MVGNTYCGFTKWQKHMLSDYASNLLSVVVENIRSYLPLQEFLLQNVIFHHSVYKNELNLVLCSTNLYWVLTTYQTLY